MNLSHRTLYVISSALWIIAGVMLLYKGVVLLASHQSTSLVFNQFASIFNNQDVVAILYMALALLIGNLKGTKILHKVAQKSKKHLQKLPNPTSLFNIFPRQTFIIILAMIALGIVLNKMDVASDIRGFIDTAVGTALIRGARSYFAFIEKKKSVS